MSIPTGWSSHDNPMMFHNCVQMFCSNRMMNNWSPQWFFVWKCQAAGWFVSTGETIWRESRAFHATSGLVEGKTYRKPLIFQLNMFFFCKCSLKPIHWCQESMVFLFFLLPTSVTTSTQGPSPRLPCSQNAAKAALGGEVLGFAHQIDGYLCGYLKFGVFSDVHPDWRLVCAYVFFWRPYRPASPEIVIQPHPMAQTKVLKTVGSWSLFPFGSAFTGTNSYFS